LNYVCTITRLADEDQSNTKPQQLLQSVSRELACNSFQNDAFEAVALSTSHMCVLAAEGEGHCQEGIAEEAWSAGESSTFMCIKVATANSGWLV